MRERKTKQRREYSEVEVVEQLKNTWQEALTDPFNEIAKEDFLNQFPLGAARDIISSQSEDELKKFYAAWLLQKRGLLFEIKKTAAFQGDYYDKAVDSDKPRDQQLIEIARYIISYGQLSEGEHD